MDIFISSYNIDSNGFFLIEPTKLIIELRKESKGVGIATIKGERLSWSIQICLRYVCYPTRAVLSNIRK